MFQDDCCFELTDPTKAVSKLSSLFTSSGCNSFGETLTDNGPFYYICGMLSLLHLSLFWCSDLPQRVQWGFPTEPGAASFTVDCLSDLTAVSRLLDCGLLERLPLTCPSKMGDCLLPSRSCTLCSAIASFWGAMVFAFSSVKLASDYMRSDSAVLGISSSIPTTILSRIISSLSVA